MALIGITPDLIFNGMETLYSWMTMPVEVSDIELPSIMMAENDLCVCLDRMALWLRVNVWDLISTLILC